MLSRDPERDLADSRTYARRCGFQVYRVSEEEEVVLDWEDNVDELPDERLPEETPDRPEPDAEEPDAEGLGADRALVLDIRIAASRCSSSSSAVAG